MGPIVNRDQFVYMMVPLAIGLVLNVVLDWIIVPFWKPLGVWLVWHSWSRWAMISFLTLLLSYPLYRLWLISMYGVRNLSSLFGLAMAMVWAIRNEGVIAPALHLSHDRYIGLVVFVGGGLFVLALAGVARGLGFWPRNVAR